MIEAYLEFIISGFLNVSAPINTENGEALSIVFSYFCLIIALGVVPYLLVWVIRLSPEKLKEEEFETKWGSLYDGVRVEEKI